jgi:hypothetical protein
MLLNMPMDEAKALRMRFGAEKYGNHVRQGISFLAEAYVEAVDQANYYDLALKTGEIDEERHAELQGLLHSGVLAPLRRTIVRQL